MLNIPTQRTVPPMPRKRSRKKDIKAIKKAKKRIDAELERLRAENTRKHYESDFKMTHDIAVISGKISGLLMILEEIDKQEDNDGK